MAGITISGLTKRFGVTQVLRGVSLAVAPGEFVALVGPSGCGKTTLMRIIAGIETADAGEVVIGERAVTRLRPAKRDIAMVFQSYALYPHLTVRENIAVPLAMRRLSAWQRLPLLGGLLPGARARRAAIAEEVVRAAAPLGLEPLLDRRPGQLSGGQRQRVALARAIIRRPAAFLMDEPLSNLDAALRVQTRREIVEIHRAVGVATLYVTHDQAEALTMADKVAVMMGGELLQVAPPEAIYAEPADLRVAGFIGSPRINTLAAAVDAAGRVTVAGLPVGLRTEARGALTLALRPEALRPAAEGLPAIAEHLEFLGDGLLLHARHTPDGAPLILRLEPEAREGLRPGAALRLGFAPSRALLFGADGRRVAARADAPLVAA
ncbi:ABC transporter ATP-binding protein [Belnapia rosea]|uniref:Carbohydrate ABC transporter ATP-binding protein, CUT1 family n=1 Tax=Belnapia rosea TaxID=938405 RepID=A0A1G7AN16_9PROT|nr:ABC transporter ATP-binding protein [Belnapia rosea]SDE16182.1 carbohydrate ABC transporter ATP-binding protein, CUT1 family [Belnapia rosea]